MLQLCFGWNSYTVFSSSMDSEALVSVSEICVDIDSSSEPMLLPRRLHPHDKHFPMAHHRSPPSLHPYVARGSQSRGHASAHTTIHLSPLSHVHCWSRVLLLEKSSIAGDFECGGVYILALRMALLSHCMHWGLDGGALFE